MPPIATPDPMSSMLPRPSPGGTLGRPLPGTPGNEIERKQGAPGGGLLNAAVGGFDNGHGAVSGATPIGGPMGLVSAPMNRPAAMATSGVPGSLAPHPGGPGIPGMSGSPFSGAAGLGSPSYSAPGFAAKSVPGFYGR